MSAPQSAPLPDSALREIGDVLRKWADLRAIDYYLPTIPEGELARRDGAA